MTDVQGLQSVSQPPMTAPSQSAPVTHPQQSVAEAPAPHAAAVASQYSTVTNAAEPAFDKVLTTHDVVTLAASVVESKAWCLSICMSCLMIAVLLC